jgi:hypothetical protein
MDHFDRYTNYNDQSGVSSVVFGSGKSVLEVELNEIQEIFKTSLRSIIAGVCGNGITDANKITYTSDTFNIASGCYIAVDGILINCTGLSKTISSGNIYLQVWEDTVDFRSVLKKQGNQDSNETVTNYIKDNRSSDETTRRKVIKYTLATSQDNTKHNLLIATVANGTCEIKIPEINLPKLKESLNNAMVRADSPDADGFSQLYKTVNGQRVDIDPKTSGGAPYIYMTADEYELITPVTDQLYWVTGANGKHGVYLNGSCIEGTNLLVHIYGVSWDGTSTTSWTRTDDAADFSDPVPYISGASNYGSPFDNLMPWSGMVKEERTGGTMVAIPKFWYKLTQNGDSIKIQIADSEMDGFHVSPAHMDRGDGKGERDVVYIGRYHCASDYKSKTGVKPVANITRPSARTSIHNLGSTIWQSDFAMRFTLWLLYIVEFADWNSQAKIGAGCGNNSSTENMGYTDSMPYHTGTTLSNRTSKGLGTQYRNIEGLWDNVLDWTDGAYYNNSGMNIILNPANFSDSAGGTLIGNPSNGYPSKFSVVDTNGAYPMFYPTEANGSTSTHSCDSWGFGATYPCIYVGGYYYHNDYYGMFCIVCGTSTLSDGDIGSRIMELP